MGPGAYLKNMRQLQRYCRCLDTDQLFAVTGFSRLLIYQTPKSPGTYTYTLTQPGICQKLMPNMSAVLFLILMRSCTLCKISCQKVVCDILA